MALLTVTLVQPTGWARAQTEVKLAEATRLATSWLPKNPIFQNAARRSGRAFRIKEVRVVDLGADRPIYHVSLEPRGYVLVQCDRRFSPVLAFSDSSDLDLSDVPENTLRRMLERDLDARKELRQGLTDRLAERHRFSKQEALALFQTHAENNRRRWVKWLDPDAASAPTAAQQEGTASANAPDAMTILVDEMLTTRWSQGKHYNKLCPLDPNATPAYDGRVPCGCGATALGQTLAYHRWPTHGMGSKSYTDAWGRSAAPTPSISPTPTTGPACKTPTTGKWKSPRMPSLRFRN
ncbi:MAG TPA: C10 family peptidase [Verrucomicrobiae bacterium]|nr:C10 family peptidase [Verrucomicrobiae bacterium]